MPDLQHALVVVDNTCASWFVESVSCPAPSCSRSLLSSCLLAGRGDRSPAADRILTGSAPWSGVGVDSTRTRGPPPESIERGIFSSTLALNLYLTVCHGSTGFPSLSYFFLLPFSIHTFLCIEGFFSGHNGRQFIGSSLLGSIHARGTLHH